MEALEPHIGFLLIISLHCVGSSHFPKSLICESQTPEERRRGFLVPPT